MLTRRNAFVAGAAALAAPAQAAGPDSAQLYHQALVVDGNLSSDLVFDDKVVGADQARRIRACGLSAFKQTLGGATGSFAHAEEDIAAVKAAVARNPDLFMTVLHAGQIAEAKRSGKVGVILSFEAGSMHEGRLASIDHFAGEGVRVMGLSYNIGSPFGGGTLQGADAGLTPLGRQAVARMNALGVTLDISHSNDTTGLRATAASNVPVLITHAGCAAVHPHPRNKSDRLLRAVAERGGVSGIYDLSYLGGYPAYPTLDLYMCHLTHALDVCGEDHVGVGSDTELLSVDTSPTAMAGSQKDEAERRASGVAAPEELALPIVVGLNGPDRWQVICAELLRRGYRAPTVEKVLGSNFARVFTETWAARA